MHAYLEKLIVWQLEHNVTGRYMLLHRGIPDVFKDRKMEAMGRELGLTSIVVQHQATCALNAPTPRACDCEPTFTNTGTN